MKLFRWGGLVFFSAIILLVVVTGMFLVEPYVKNYLSTYLSEKNSATVNIDDLNISYWPLKINIKGIQFADSQKLNINALQIDAVDFELSTADLLLKKLIINEMKISNVRINTARSLAAKKITTIVEQKTTVENNKEESYTLPSIDVPDVNQLIKNESLESNVAYIQLKQDVAETEKKWQETKKNIADKQRWNQYDQRYNVIKKGLKGNLKAKLKALKDAKKLKQDLQQEIANIRQAKTTIKQGSARLNKDFQRMQKAPANDVAALKNKYRLDNINTENISQLLFGDKATGYILLARRWYKKIQPFMQSNEDENKEVHKRDAGQDIIFAEYQPKPMLLIKHVSLSARLPRGDFLGEIKNISSKQSINQQPMSFVLAGQQMKNRNSEEIRGEINFVNASKMTMWVDYKLRADNLENIILSRSKSLPLSIKRSVMDVDANVRLENAQLSAKALLNFKNVDFSSDAQGSSSSMEKLMLRSFDDIKQFKVNANFVGALDQLKFKLRSDLDNKVGAQMKRQLKQKMAMFDKDLKQSLNEKYKEPLQKLNNRRQALDNIKQDIDQREKEIKQRIADLQQNIETKKKAKQQKLKDKLKSKKADLKKKLFKKLGF